eukprot:TRINITY_DN87411_c0_g1_i1.p1 TRINITY_DN87411_c0_g1~~TRINITY_DN87411_c0_g1_i1.p1  ORF type:complete len:462 (-),score=68.02 TRINITY_DN87411_c0_g1_i1:60-1415(-)
MAKRHGRGFRLVILVGACTGIYFSDVLVLPAYFQSGRHSSASRTQRFATLHEVNVCVEEAADKSAQNLDRASLGDEVLGTVLDDSDDGVTLDIGSGVHGFIERGDFMGAARPTERFQVGQQLQTIVWKITKGKLLLRFPRERSRTCFTCFQTLPAQTELFGHGGHHEDCIQAWHLGRGKPALFELDGQPFHCVVGPVTNELKKRVDRLVKRGNVHWASWNKDSSRPDQKGRLHGIGMSLSSHIHFKGTHSLRDEAQAVLDDLLASPIVALFNDASHDINRPRYPEYKSPPLPSLQPGVGNLDVDGGCLNTYVGQGYMAVRANASQHHGPPVPVAKLLGVASCKNTCLTCKMQGCQACCDCCMRVDSDDSISLLLGVQEPETQPQDMAFFCMGNKAFPLAGGRAFLFDGKRIPHGVWCMHGHYVGMAFVKKMPWKHPRKWPIDGLKQETQGQ